MINPPLRKIQTLACLAETGSFRGTAERLGISQPAVSAHIRDLEELYGVALVNRTTRRVALTAEGRAFAARALRALAELDDASRDLHDLGAAHRGVVTVACVPPLLTVVIPRVLARLDSSHPAVEVRLLDVLSRQVDPLLLRGDVDIGIGPRFESTETVFERLKREDFVAAVPRDNPLAERHEVSLTELARYPFIANARAANARKFVDRAFERANLTLRPRFEFVHYFSIGRFVEAGLGVTILPRLAFPGLASDGIVAVEIRSPRMWRDLGLTRRKEYQPSPAAKAFIAALREVFAEIPIR